MLQRHAWVEYVFKVQNKLIDFNVTVYKKFINNVSNSILQLTFKKLPLVECWCSSKEDYPQLLKKKLLKSLPAI